jgi:hypothetical protein
VPLPDPNVCGIAGARRAERELLEHAIAADALVVEGPVALGLPLASGAGHLVE